jgi:flagellar transcriptional activator FlhD
MREPNSPTENDAMTPDQNLAELREANLTFLMLAQNLIRIDREQALCRLGVSEEIATLIDRLTPAQMEKFAACKTNLTIERDLSLVFSSA